MAAALLNFEPAKRRAQEERPHRAAWQGEAEILFFTGVRIERWTEEAPVRPRPDAEQAG
ncbi:hypothetical protein [Lutibaculum baratangense]|uniref:Uncharacterized protein n=1 Tax=Lutibaculum baratangense AMV1 TaxID=631454 RepID=V4QSL8_9HYPH|nr:hypothetical protein [Lutibaculum baratangense]ESR22772.1 hypothetical protein N177_3909 [Lutibaculum baratangense AMV1]